MLYGPLLLGVAAVPGHDLPRAVLLGGVVGCLFIAQDCVRARGPASARFYRSTAGKIVGVCALALTGPTAVLVEGGPLLLAALVYVTSVMFFTGGVLSVEAILVGVRIGTVEAIRDRWQIGRAVVLHHAVLAALVMALFALRNPAAFAASIAIAPALVRTRVDWTRYGSKPVLKQIGLRETAIAVWFVCLAAIALRRAL